VYGLPTRVARCMGIHQEHQREYKMPKTGYVKLRALGNAIESRELKPTKATEKAYKDALEAYLGRVHRPRHAKPKKKGA